MEEKTEKPVRPCASHFLYFSLEDTIKVLGDVESFGRHLKICSEAPVSSSTVQPRLEQCMRSLGDRAKVVWREGIILSRVNVVISSYVNDKDDIVNMCLWTA